MNAQNLRYLLRCSGRQILGISGRWVMWTLSGALQALRRTCPRLMQTVECWK